ncbi:MAG: antibiotic biosynthesis monooxygenase [Sphingobacteriaceae bacterium]|nr:antibiotic biosynthesis monooxygenase [Sphingobacteriaceae bacterium]
MIATTPSTPYYAVIFTSVKNQETPGYEEMAALMLKLAQQQDGFLGYESAREEIGITVSYWSSLEAIKRWKENSEHKIAQKLGYEHWYTSYKTRICLVERDYPV